MPAKKWRARREPGTGELVRAREIPAFCCPSQQSPRVAGKSGRELQGQSGQAGLCRPVLQVRAGKGERYGSAWEKSCGRALGTFWVFSFWDLISEFCAVVGYRSPRESSTCLSGGCFRSLERCLAVPPAHPPGQILQTHKRSRSRTQTRFPLKGVPVPSWGGSVWAGPVTLSGVGYLESST